MSTLIPKITDFFFKAFLKVVAEELALETEVISEQPWTESDSMVKLGGQCFCSYFLSI